jgi:hypothetical protein
MRIVWDVSPLSHELTGAGRYHRGSLAAVAEAAQGEHEIVAFARARWRAFPSSSSSSSCRSRTTGARRGAGSAARRSSGSSAVSTCSTSRTGCFRPSGPELARP